MLRKAVYSFFITGAVVGILSLVRCSNGPAAQPTNDTQDSSQANKPDLAARGKYLVTTMGCNDCHSSKKMTPQGPVIDSAFMLAGYLETKPQPPFEGAVIQKGYAVMVPDLTAAMGPWGTTFAANITPDSTGIGSWTVDQFKKALREGKFKGLEGTRPLMPPMPWQNYVSLADDDAEAIFAYLKTIKPVKNRVPDFRPMN